MWRIGSLMWGVTSIVDSLYAFLQASLIKSSILSPSAANASLLPILEMVIATLLTREW